MEGRLIARALAGRDDLEARSARPIDMLADERRLIAPGEAVDHARGRAFEASSGPATTSASTLTITTCLPFSITFSAVIDPGLGIAGRLDDHLNVGERDQRVRIVRDVRAPLLNASPSEAA